jgi:nitrite reductase/ring-hydroxylating ferredoxin subunit
VTEEAFAHGGHLSVSASVSVSASEGKARSRSLRQWRVFSGAEADINKPETEKEEEVAPVVDEGPPLGPEFIPVLSSKELPKGQRKEVTLDGKQILVFWYRNELQAIEAKSTAEAFYSEGFKTAKFTQDYGIICPTTESVFSIRNGGVLEWYPSNPVLRQLTPKETCRPIEIYSVCSRGDVIYVNPEGNLKDWVPASGLRSDFTMPGQVSQTLGGSDTSVEGNNVYGIEPKMYLQGTDASTPMGEDAPSAVSKNLSPVTVIVGTVAAGIVGVAGTGVCLFYENYIGLAVFWLAGISAVGYLAQSLTNFGDDEYE